MYWYVWIAAIHKRQTSSFFSSSWLETTGSENVAPTKTRAFPVLYSETYHLIFFSFLFKTKALQPLSPLCMYHMFLQGILGLAIRVNGHMKTPWLRGLSPREICCKQWQKSWCPPQNWVQPHWAMLVPAQFSSACHCSTRLFSYLWLSLFSSSLCWARCDQQTCLTKLMLRVRYAGTVRDEACRERWGKKGEKGGSPCVELTLEVKFLLHETQEIRFPSDFMDVWLC